MASRSTGQAGRQSDLLVRVEALESRRLLAVELVADINQTTTSSDVGELKDVSGVVFAQIYNPDIGYGLWKTAADGQGMTLMKPIKAKYLTNVDGMLFCSAFGANNRDLWRSDGTAAGTVEVQTTGMRASFPC